MRCARGTTEGVETAMIPESWMKFVVLALLIIGIAGEVIIAVHDWDDENDDEARRGGKNDDVS
ncbi:MAG: hypothetical protein Q4D58_09890 [Synergistaceae bacterium]|nr:hypothetical protein [Synergistaceae bacterium]